MMRDHWTFFKGATQFSCIDATGLWTSMAPDTVTLIRPNIALAKGDVITLKFFGVTKFVGTILDKDPEQRGGTSTTATYVAYNAWHKIREEFYTQEWATVIGGEGAVFRHSRVILNQAITGAPVSLTAQIADILSIAAALGYITIGTVNVPAVYLPYDEQRSITLEQALQRVLRFFPLVYTWFDYSTTPPTINMGQGSAAEWMDLPAFKSTSLLERESGLPLEGVILDLESTGDNGGTPYRMYSQQTAGTVTPGARIMRIPLDLKGNSSSITSRTIDVTTEAIPADWTTNKTWWKSKHPRLENVTIDEMTLSAASRICDDIHPRISLNPIDDLAEAGLEACMSTFKINCTVKKDEGGETFDEEELIMLTMDFITTSATSRKYTWTDSSYLELGEWIPTGLAAALLAQHAHDGEEVTCVYRPLAAFWALPGQSYDNLYATNISISLNSDLATVVFAPQTALSAQDLAGMMTGWRNCGGSSSSYCRTTSKPKVAAQTTEKKIAPTKTTEFSPGTKKTSGVKNSTAKATVSADDLDTGDHAKFRETTIVTDSATNEKMTVKVLRSANPDEAIAEDVSECGSDPYIGGGDGSGDGGGLWPWIPPYDDGTGGITGDGSGGDDSYFGKTGDCW